MITLAEALADFRAADAENRIVGYCYAPGAGNWFALDSAGVACGPGGPLDLDAVYEVHATDGGRELRWLQTAAGAGRTAVLADAPQPVRLPPQRRKLAGDVISAGSTSTGPWVTLFSPRYGQVDIPVEAAPGERVEIESAEYVTEDAHGNLTVAGTRWVGLRRTGAGHD
jgi:hypothetical protein